MRKLLSILIILLTLTSCSEKPLTENEFQLGTIITITAFDKIGKDHIEGCFDVIDEVDSLLDFHSEDSELGYLNANAHLAPLKVSDELYELISTAYDMTVLTGGAFNLAIGPLVELWDIGGLNARVPDSDEIESVLPLLDWNNIILDDNEKTVYFAIPGMKIDLGGIGKGYAADKVVEYLKENGVEKALLNLGGNVYALGEKEKGTPWKVGIRKPEDESSEFFTVVEVSDESVVTSGGYERYFIDEDGRRYHHILDSRTGYPAESDILSVTIVDESSTLSDVLSTATFALGSVEGKALLESLGVEGVFLLEDGSVVKVNP